MTTTLSISSSGPEYGSASKTSSAAPATLPDCERVRAAPPRRRSSPRAALTRRTPSRIFAKAPASIEPRVSGGQRQVQGEEVGRREHLVLRLEPLHAELAKALPGDERVVGDDAHLEPERPSRDLLADPTEAEHAERLARELEPAVASSAPSGPP